MYLVNRFNRVVEIDDESIAAQKIKSGRMREATQEEIARHITQLQMREVRAEGSIYYQSVNATPDGYGMSRDLIKTELYKIGVTLSEEYNDQKIGLLYNYPYSIIQMRNDVRLLYTMFESDNIPEDWPDYLKVADEVIVPTKWCAEVFKKRGIDTTVVPLGYNDDVFTFVERTIPEQANDPEQPFTFIHYDSFNMRKGFAEVFKAFTQEFKKEENVRLILKTVKEHTTLPILNSQFPHIITVKGRFEESEIVDLLSQAHCMVYPSRGEGFGITPLEAMATGIPAIVPNEHGISEYFNKDYMLEVKATERCPALYGRFRNQDVGNMVVADVDDLRKQMRYAFEHQAEMYELGKKASEYVKQFTYKETARKLKEIINKWEKTEVVKRTDGKFLRVERV